VPTTKPGVLQRFRCSVDFGEPPRPLRRCPRTPRMVRLIIMLALALWFRAKLAVCELIEKENLRPALRASRFHEPHCAMERVEHIGLAEIMLGVGAFGRWTTTVF